MKESALEKRCTLVADTVVPEYRDERRSYSCTGSMAKRWQAAWDGACVALGHDPTRFRLPWECISREGALAVCTPVHATRQATAKASPVPVQRPKKEGRIS